MSTFKFRAGIVKFQAVSMLLLFVGLSQARADSWVEVGPRSGSAGVVSMHPTNPAVVYDARYSLIFRTQNGGNAWSPIAATAGAVLFDPHTPDIQYAYGYVKLQKSIDGGESWAQSSPFDAWSVAIDPSSSSHLYVGSFGLTSPVPVPGQVCVSSDGGATWSCSPLAPSGWTYPPQSIVVDPNDGNVAYAGILGDFDNPGQGIYKTINGGTTWSNVSIASFYAEIGCLAMKPHTSNVVFAGTEAGGFAPQGIFKSIDAGATWAQSSVGFPQYTGVSDIAIDPFHPETMFAVTNNGLFRSTDEGAHWATAVNAPASPRSIDFCASVADVLCLATASGVYFSTDGGAHFQHYSDPALPMVSLVVDYVNGNVLHVTGAGTYRSADRGATWPQRFEQAGTVLAQDPNNRQVLYLGDFKFGVPAPSSMIWKTTTPFPAWSPSLRDVAINDIAIARSNSSVVYAGGFKNVGVGGIFKTVDAGAHWTTATNIPTNSLAVDPTNALVVYAGGDNGMFKSTDGGAAWAPIQNGLNQPASGPVMEVQVDLIQPSTLYCGTSSQGLFKSIDGGQNWSHLSAPLTDCRAIAIDPTDTQIVYASSWKGMIGVSVDGGAHWQSLGSQALGGDDLVLDPTNRNTLYSTRDGIWRYERTSQCATPSIVAHAPEVVDLTQCSAGCTLTFDVGTPDDYSQLAVLALEHRVGNAWVQVDELLAPFAAPTWQLEYHFTQTESPGEHSFRCVARGVDGARAISGVAAVTFATGPLPTVVRSLDATAVPFGAELRWEISVDGNLSSFSITRSSGAARETIASNLAVTSRSFHDDGLTPGRTYEYQLVAVDRDGSYTQSIPVKVTIPKASVELLPNQPNPFNPETTIRFVLPEKMRVTLSVHDVAGRVVATLVDDVREPGVSSIRWNAEGVASGVYFAKLRAGKTEVSRKMVLLK